MRRYLILLVIVVSGACDKDTVPLVKRYVLDSEVSFLSRYPLRTNFVAVFASTNNNSIVFLSQVTKHTAVLIDSKGNFIKDVELPVPGLPGYLSRAKDGDIVIWAPKSQGMSDFYFVDANLNITSKKDVQTTEDPTRYAVTAVNGRLYYSLTFGQNQASSLSAFDVATGQKKWTTETTEITTLTPTIMFHPSGDILFIRLDSEFLTLGRISTEGEILWTEQTPADGVFSENHMWSNFFWRSNGDILAPSMDHNLPAGSIEIATFSDGSLSNVTPVPVDAYKSFSSQTDLRVHKIIETNDGGFLLSIATSTPPFFSLLKLDKKMNPGWIGTINLVGDAMADMVKREDESVVYLTSQGTVFIFKPEF